MLYIKLSKVKISKFQYSLSSTFSSFQVLTLSCCSSSQQAIVQTRGYTPHRYCTRFGEENELYYQSTATGMLQSMNIAHLYRLTDVGLSRMHMNYSRSYHPHWHQRKSSSIERHLLPYLMHLLCAKWLLKRMQVNVLLFSLNIYCCLKVKFFDRPYRCQVQCLTAWRRRPCRRLELWVQCGVLSRWQPSGGICDPVCVGLEILLRDWQQVKWAVWNAVIRLPSDTIHLTISHSLCPS